jgi:hypothetical protein
MKSIVTYEEEISIETGLLWVNKNERTQCRLVLLILLHTSSRSTFAKDFISSVTAAVSLYRTRVFSGWLFSPSLLPSTSVFTC